MPKAHGPARRRLTTLLLWLGGLLVVISLAGASWALHTSAQQEPTPAVPPAPVPALRGAASFGHVDARRGVVKIYAPQPGKVAKIEVEEDDRDLPAGTVLF